MTEDAGSRVSSHESIPQDASPSASAAQKQRKKRKWDQPAESLVSVGVAVPGVLPLGNMGSFAGVVPLPGVTPVSGATLMNPLAGMPQGFQLPSIQQHAAAVVQKLNQSKIQDELIAREIVINDAESSIRYKLTKRQTQEEIQKCTGAVVITRGKYRPPNALPDGEKPLYLHISAGVHLKETAERIKAVDHAAAMVEEMLKQGQNSLIPPSTFHATLSNGVKVTQALSTCVFLGFDTDPSLNIAARIHGPNDQYINHIMNETGATVLLRGRGSGNLDSLCGDDGQQPLHLFLSSNNPRSLEDAKLLAENLLDTISAECGASRVSSSKVYNAVPPPQLLLDGVQSSGNDLKVNTSLGSSLTSSNVSSIPALPVSSVAVPGVTGVISHGMVSQSGGLFNGQSQPSMVGYSQPPSICGTSYNGYGGIYPQATPLQQVALALRQSHTPSTSTVAPVSSVASVPPKSSGSSSPEKEKRPPMKRKFQELPAASKSLTKAHQGFEDKKVNGPSEYLSPRNFLSILPSKKLVPLSNKMPPPTLKTMPPSPSKTMPLPPPLPKFTSPMPILKAHEKSYTMNMSKSDAVPDTLIKLMEYGEEDDDPEDSAEESPKSNANAGMVPKPFWAL